MANVDDGGAKIPSPLARALYAIIGSTVVFLWLYWSEYGASHNVERWADMDLAGWFHVLQFTLLSYFMARAGKWIGVSNTFCGAAVVSGLVLTPLVQLTDNLPALVPGVLTYVLAVVLVTIIPEVLKKSPRQSTIGVFWAFVGVYFVFAGFHTPEIHAYLAALSSTIRTVLLVSFLVVGIGALIWVVKTRRPSIWVLIAPGFGGAAVFGITVFEPHSSSPHAWMDFAMGLCSLCIASRLRPGDESP